MSTGLFIILISILLSAFFSGTEIAFVSANRLKIELDKSKHKISGKILSWFNEREANLITMLLLGNNIALVIYGIYMEDELSPILRHWLPSYLNGAIIVLLLNTVISTLIILIFAEFIPKASFRLNSNRIIQFFSIPLYILYIILLPFVYTFIILSEIILKYVFRTNISTKKYQFTVVDLDHYIQEFHDENSMENAVIESDLQIFRNAIDFRTTKVRECMVPRTEIKAIDLHDSIAGLIKLFHNTGHSKILVFEENIDNIIGYVHAFDLIKKPKTIPQILRQVILIPETLAANVMLQKMIKENSNMAVVLDEFGGTSGIITMEDLMEEIFGEIEDEFDNDVMIEEQIDENTFLLSARLEIDYLNQTYNFNLPESEEYETLGGYVTFYHQSIPQKGTKLDIENFTFEIVQAGHTKVDLIKVYRNIIG